MWNVHVVWEKVESHVTRQIAGNRGEERGAKSTCINLLHSVAMSLY